MTPFLSTFFVKKKGGHTELLSTDFFEINYCFQMVGIFFSILPNIITLHMPRSGRWRIFVAHDFVGVQNPPNTDWHTKSFSQSICEFQTCLQLKKICASEIHWNHQNENPSEGSCEMSNLLRTTRCSNSALYIRKSEIENSVGTEILNVYYMYA